MALSSGSRRSFLAGSMAGLGGLSVSRSTSAEQQQPATAGRLTVAAVGGHPDDPETGCAGTLAAYAERGHRVLVVYLTRGEKGIHGRSPAETAALRTAEAEAACAAIGARAVFAGQMDGATELSGPRAAEFAALLESERPDVVFTHWPLDTHPDHQVAALLAWRAWLAGRRRFDLYFYEVNTGHQTLGFAPGDYVDVGGQLEKKRAALLAHRSQDGERILRVHAEVMQAFRGREAGVAAAEGFVHVIRPELPIKR